MSHDPSTPDAANSVSAGRDGREPSLKDLVSRLGDDAAALLRGEVALARLELRQTVREITIDSVKIAAAAALAAAGGLALLAAAILLLGRLLDGAYWAAAAILGAVLLAAGALLLRAGIGGLRDQSIAPKQTIDTLRRDGHWARAELNRLRSDLTERTETR